MSPFTEEETGLMLLIFRHKNSHLDSNDETTLKCHYCISGHGLIKPNYVQQLANHHCDTPRACARGKYRRSSSTQDLGVLATCKYSISDICRKIGFIMLSQILHFVGHAYPPCACAQPVLCR